VVSAAIYVAKTAVLRRQSARYKLLDTVDGRTCDSMVRFRFDQREAGMHRKEKEVKAKKKREKLRWLVIGIGLGYAAYSVANKKKPAPCLSAGGPDERVIIKDEENIGGLGAIMGAMVKELLKNPEKLALLEQMNLVLAIEPAESPEIAITLTFSNGYIILEPGVVPDPDILISTTMEILMQMAGMGSGLDALKFFQTPEGKQMVEKMRAGDLKIKGLTSHPIAMMKFSKFLSPSAA
jgi:hypothetical protein